MKQQGSQRGCLLLLLLGQQSCSSQPLVLSEQRSWVCRACGQTQNQRGWHKAARGEHLLQAQDELCFLLSLCSPAHTGFVKKPHGLSQSRRLLKPTRGLRVSAILGASQGEPLQGAWRCARSAGNMGLLAATGCWGFAPCAAQFLQHPPCLPAAQTEQQVGDHQLLGLCRTA